jgi:membrane associated rhomboid family serine protease
MVTSSLAHADLSHLFWNLLFYLAFAPALEILIGNALRYVWIMLFIAFVVGVCDSISVVIGVTEPLPSLGFSGIVMGMIGLSAYLMPKAKIKVFCWYVFAWKTFYVRAWILAVYYIGGETWVMFTAEDYGNIGVVAHVAGGLAGYFAGRLFLKGRKSVIDSEISIEIEAMHRRQTLGKIPEEAYRYARKMEANEESKREKVDDEKIMKELYKFVSVHRDSEAICLLLERYDMDTPINDLEMLFNRISEWGPSRTLLCLGRLIIHLFDEANRHNLAIAYIDKCQAISPKFILPVDDRTVFYSNKAIDMGMPEVSKKLLRIS